MKAFAYATALLSTIAQLSFAAQLSVFEKVSAIPEGWVQGERVPSDRRMKFRLAIKQEQAHAFEQHVIDISTPNHPKYGQHLSREELKRSLKPSSDASKAILDWLASEDVNTIEDDGGWINFVTTAGKIERMLDTEFAISS